jgi:hypothetical protein
MLPIAAAAACAVIFVIVTAMADRSLRTQRWMLLGLGLVTAAYAFGAIGEADALLDRSQVTVLRSQVLDKHISYGRAKTYHLKLAPWGPMSEGGDVSVAQAVYDRLEAGSTACIVLRAGALGMPWFIVLPCQGETNSWEGQPPDSLQDCKPIEPALIVAIPIAHRSEAIAQLESVSIIELDQSRLTALLDLTPDTSASAPAWIKAAIGSLNQKRRSELEDHVGGWTQADQNHLDRLQTLQADPLTATLKPFLVRAVAKNEATGGFYVSSCRDSLAVSHVSLGHSVPTSKRLPIIVFLKRAPTRVYVGWQMAE